MEPDTQAQHVVPHDGKWGIRAENSQQPSKLFDTKIMAVAAAFDIADNNDGKVVIHGSDGVIQSVTATQNASKLLTALKA